ncbi:hypothetical protein F2Q69_00005285 [Brassica cretica]|uniref:Secreted protein n=1 Tax=Brassica cretica TaxID=69181 RepID=A0A8S9PP70_BRACR|nr:hypothetical protein F2Q69_00005285 [Brassica cretica]
MCLSLILFATGQLMVVLGSSGSFSRMWDFGLLAPWCGCLNDKCWFFFLLGFFSAISHCSSDVRRQSSIKRCGSSLNKVRQWSFSSVSSLILVHYVMVLFPENFFNSANFRFQRNDLCHAGFRL